MAKNQQDVPELYDPNEEFQFRVIIPLAHFRTGKEAENLKGAQTDQRRPMLYRFGSPGHPAIIQHKRMVAKWE